MNNEQATTNASTVEVEEQHHPEEAVSEAETPDVNTEADIAVQEEADSGEMAAEPTTETAESTEAEESLAEKAEEEEEPTSEATEGTDADVETDADAETESDIVAVTDAETDADIDADTTSDIVAVTDADIDADVETESDIVAVTDAETDADADADAVHLTDEPAPADAAAVAITETDPDAVPLTDEPAPADAAAAEVLETDPDAVPLTEGEAPADEAVAAAAPEEPPEPMSPEALEEAYDNSIKAFTDGEIVKGTVVSVTREEVLIDIGFKSEGYVPAEEFGGKRNETPPVNVGDVIDVYIVRREDAEGQIVLSKKIADQTLIWDEISTAYESGGPVDGRITERIKGGLRVSVGSLRGFLPASQVEIRPIQNLERYVGQTFPMKVISLSKRRHNIVLSRRAWLEAEMARKKAEVLDRLEVGELVPGVVKNITAFGAFVDLGGVDGLLHKTDMSWRRIHHPSEVVTSGQEVEVVVLGIGKEKEKISLGLKQKTPDPWANVEEKYPIGSTVSGKVVNIVNYGAFLQLEEGVEGLIHVSEMAWTRRNVAPSRIVNKGQEIEARVLEISRADKRISLGLKQLQQNPWEVLAEKYPAGTKVTGRIRNLTPFGAFVEIENGIDGLIHTSDLSWTKRGSAARELKEGKEIEVVVLHIDAEERRVSLGLKQTQPDPWTEVPEKYKVGTIVRGKIVNITSFGAFTKLEEGIEGLIHISELANRRIEKPDDVVSLGQELDLKVINLSPQDRRIGLSLRAALAEQERGTEPEEEQARPPRQERRARPRREREREPRRPRQMVHEETVTTLGALLKEEMGKSNAAENADNANN